MVRLNKSIFLFLIYIALFLSCSSDSFNPPKKVVDKFKSALKSLDFEEAWNCLSEEAQMRDYKILYNFKLWVVAQGKNLKDYYKVSYYSGVFLEENKVQLFYYNKKSADFTVFILVKENNKWKILEFYAHQGAVH